MRAEHIEILVEEPSMEAFLVEILPRILGKRASFTIHPYQGKSDLLNNLENRLRGYARWLPETWRILVIIDRDNDECTQLKQRLEQKAIAAGLQTRSQSQGAPWQVANRIAIEELEAWYFGDWSAVKDAYPKVPDSIPAKAPYRIPDNILGGTWEALERIFKRAGYFSGGIRKTEVAQQIGQRINLNNNTSHSFNVFCSVVEEAIA